MARRLRLDAVQEIGKPSYRFRYEEGTNPMPSRSSFAKDHWGYYNGSTGNSSLLPSVPTYLLALYGASAAQGGNRAANGQIAQLGALKQVQYPTGGYTTFEYEPNILTRKCEAPALAYQFGEPLAMNCNTVGAHATGGSFQMDATELRYQAEHGEGLMDGTTLPSNVDAQIIDAPNGFYLCNMTWNGLPSFWNSAHTSCLIAQQRLRTSLWRAAYDSVSQTYGAVTEICKVDYSSNHNCQPVMVSTCGTKISQVFPPGSYMLVAEVSASNLATISTSITAQIIYLPDPDPVPSGPNTPPLSSCFVNWQVGGIRLRQTTDRTAAGEATTRTFRYCPAGQPERSSAQLFSFPQYSYTNACRDLIVGASDVGKNNWLDVGYHLGYDRVEVESKGRQAGTTVYYYRNSGAEMLSARSLVTKIEELDQEGRLVKETVNDYQVMYITSSPGFQLSEDYNQMSTLLGQDPMTNQNFSITSIANSFLFMESRSYNAHWPQLTATTERIAGTGSASTLGLPSRTVHNYLSKAPGRTTQPVRTAKYLSDGRQLITKTLYCGQYALGNSTLSGAARGIQELANKRCISVPVEHQMWQRLGADSSVVGGDLTHFVQGRPARILALATAAPIPASQFVSSHIQTNTLQQDAHYIERVSFPRYSATGNLLEQHVTAAAPNCYFWGYDETQLVAEVKGATRAQTAYTSFEEGGMGSFKYNPTTISANHPRVAGGRTGVWAFWLGNTGQVRRDSLPAGNYELTLWAQSAQPPSVPGNLISTPAPEEIATAPGGWHQFRWRITCQANASFAISVWSGESPILIDEVRLYPVGAHMTSYTYDPLVGMTSQTDPAGRTTTYEYDALGRLLRMRDEQNRIQAQQEYHYARP
jgi:YD repeat-containing protein